MSEHASTQRAGDGRSATAALAFGTLGIVFGDIGTSPLYAFRESFEVSDLPVDETTALGVASVVVWSLVVVISLKYLLLVMRADNGGEGGILALTALVLNGSEERSSGRSKLRGAVIALGVFGTALLYGDGLITPAISVLAAVEGFEATSDAFADWIVPIAVVILVVLFAVQRRGTERIARWFSPVMVVWFTVLGLLGVRQIAKHPDVLRAVSPTYAIELFVEHPYRAFIALGSIFLVVTGGEALYADMGHFGRRAIQWSWYGLVLPGLLLNYFGQAAFLAARPGAEVGSPFYAMAPSWALTPLVLLATAATVIASQALISGAFSLTVQAVNLDYFPRLAVHHTSAHHIGQVYVPLVNWLLMIGCIGLVVVFQSSSNLAAAYGIAVTSTMLITTLIFYRVVRDRWGWSVTRALVTLVPFLVVDVAFFAANVPKIPAGGWFPIVVGVGLVVQMTTWRRGRQLVAERFRRRRVSLADFAASDAVSRATRVPGTAVYLFKDSGGVPPALIANVRHHRALHERTLLVSVDTASVPHVGFRKRAHYTRVTCGISTVRITFGFRDDPDVPAVLAAMSLPGGDLDTDEVTYFLGRETITAGKAPGMHPLREQLFVLLNRGAASAARFFRLPPEQVLEVGTQVEI